MTNCILCDRRTPSDCGVCSECVASNTPKKAVPMGGVGMPAHLYLEEFGSQVWSAFGDTPYHVGSSLTSKVFRDVDVRLMLLDDEYDKLFPGKLDQHLNVKWVSLCLAFSALGKQMTGLPIDFQIQKASVANKKYPGPRSALGIVGLRIRD